MSSPYVGDESCIEIEGWRFYYVSDLSNGAAEDLAKHDKAQGGDGRLVHAGKLLELAVTRMVTPEGEDRGRPNIRRMKDSWVGQIQAEVMAKWFPLAWQALQRTQTPPDGISGPPLTGIEASASSVPTG